MENVREEWTVDSETGLREGERVVDSGDKLPVLYSALPSSHDVQPKLRTLPQLAPLHQHQTFAKLRDTH